MRKERARVGMQIAHKRTGRHLGEITELLINLVKFKPAQNYENMPYGIAGYAEIEPFYGEEDET